MIKRRCCAEIGVAVVAVDAARLDLFAVDQHYATDNAKIAEADKKADMLAARRDEQAVQVWRFVTPKQGCVDLKGKHGGVIFAIALAKSNGDTQRLTERWTMAIETEVVEAVTGVEKDETGRKEELFDLNVAPEPETTSS